MNSKIRGASVSLAVVAACAFTAAPVNPAAGAVAHHNAALRPFTGFSGDRLCDLASVTLCMSGDDGLNGEITGVNTSIGTSSELHVTETVSTMDCNDGKVSEGDAGEGPPCPFTDGSGLNAHFHNKTIVQLFNTANLPPGPNYRYAAFVEPAGYGVIEESAGSGQVWVQVGDLSGTSPDAIFVNVAASDKNGTETILCTNGDGHQLPVREQNEAGAPPSTCTWANFGP